MTKTTKPRSAISLVSCGNFFWRFKRHDSVCFKMMKYKTFWPIAKAACGLLGARLSPDGWNFGRAIYQRVRQRFDGKVWTETRGFGMRYFACFKRKSRATVQACPKKDLPPHLPSSSSLKYKGICYINSPSYCDSGDVKEIKITSREQVTVLLHWLVRRPTSCLKIPNSRAFHFYDNYDNSVSTAHYIDYYGRWTDKACFPKRVCKIIPKEKESEEKDSKKKKKRKKLEEPTDPYIIGTSCVGAGVVAIGAIGVYLKKKKKKKPDKEEKKKPQKDKKKETQKDEKKDPKKDEKKETKKDEKKETQKDEKKETQKDEKKDPQKDEKKETQKDEKKETQQSDTEQSDREQSDREQSDTEKGDNRRSDAEQSD